MLLGGMMLRFIRNVFVSNKFRLAFVGLAFTAATLTITITRQIGLAAEIHKDALLEVGELFGILGLITLSSCLVGLLLSGNLKD